MSAFVAVHSSQLSATLSALGRVHLCRPLPWSILPGHSSTVGDINSTSAMHQRQTKPAKKPLDVMHPTPYTGLMEECKYQANTNKLHTTVSSTNMFQQHCSVNQMAEPIIHTSVGSRCHAAPDPPWRPSQHCVADEVLSYSGDQQLGYCSLFQPVNTMPSTAVAHASFRSWHKQFHCRHSTEVWLHWAVIINPQSLAISSSWRQVTWHVRQ